MTLKLESLDFTQNASLEAIQQQDDAFFRELTDTVERLRGTIPESDLYHYYEAPETSLPDSALLDVSKMKRLLSRTELDMADMLTPINDCIRKHTNLPVVTFAANDENAWVFPPFLDGNNPLLHGLRKDPIWNDVYDQMLRRGLDTEGYVNLKTAKVGRVFSEIEVPMYVCWWWVLADDAEGPTAAQVAAIILHEVGHVFTAYEMLTRTTTTNFLLSAITAECANRPMETRKAIITSNLKRHGGYNANLSKAKTLDDAEIAVVVLTAVNDKCRAELGVTAIDERNAEYLADEFAARLGAGRALAEGLDYIHTRFGTSRTRFQSLIDLAILVAVTCVAWPVGLMMAMFGLLSGFIVGQDYPDNNQRFTMMRQQIIQKLKAGGFDRTTVAAALRDLDRMQELVKKYPSQWYGLGDLIAMVLSPRVRRYHLDQRAQTLLQDLGNNELFVTGMKLQQLSEARKNER